MEVCCRQNVWVPLKFADEILILGVIAFRGGGWGGGSGKR